MSLPDVITTDEIPGPTDNPACLCPVTGLFEPLGNKYAMQVVCVIGAYGRARFSDVEAAVPDASTSTLSTRLEVLAAEGLVTRSQYDEVPPRVEYELTDDGRELTARLLPLLVWVCDREGVVDADEIGDVDGGLDLGALVGELGDLLNRD